MSEAAEPRRRGAQLVTIYWRDIPTQVNGQQGRVRHQVPLDWRFMQAVARASAKARIHTSHEYTLQWRRVARPCGDDLEAEATAEAARLEAEWPQQRLGMAAFLGGWEHPSEHEPAAFDEPPEAAE